MEEKKKKIKKNLYRYDFDLPTGEIWIGETGGSISDLFFGPRELTDENICETPVIAETAKQVREYFSRERTAFDVPMAPAGTDFQKDVWREIYKIPYGETRYYAEIASPLKGNQQARAIGMAAGKNPIAILIPCHRLIGKDGSLTGYAYGFEIKEYLLAVEGSLLGFV
ncbi:MAG: methylated-DNA--[protein]-cysteine S-methyltransferase [Clostridiales Family XIII bacterium]|jgi:methylated-DNA-[protein]-cysteine S-methyltransferase|nr:methylated-DNA--[protein]-cysteine S-methyltransferase [Clostridiales Family XIII bacterium]